MKENYSIYNCKNSKWNFIVVIETLDFNQIQIGSGRGNSCLSEMSRRLLCLLHFWPYNF